MDFAEKYIRLVANIRGSLEGTNNFLEGMGKGFDKFEVVMKAKAQREELERIVELINKLNDSTSN